MMLIDIASLEIVTFDDIEKGFSHGFYTHLVPQRITDKNGVVGIRWVNPNKDLKKPKKLNLVAHAEKGDTSDHQKKIKEEQGIPDDFKYLAIAESGLMNVGSPAGARGYWQILEDTGKEYGLEITATVDERYHFEKATMAASRYFKKAHAKFGDWTAVAASYNMGQSGFSKRQEEQLHRNYYDLYLNEETSRYLFRILAFKVIFENPGKFGYHLQEEDYYQNPEFKTFEIQGDIKDLPQWAKNQGSNFKYLKLYNPWLRDRNLKSKKGKVYEIRLPK
jgi:hypothetical protein